MSEAAKMLKDIQDIRSKYVDSPDNPITESEWATLEDFAKSILALEEAMENDEEQKTDSDQAL